MTAFSTIFLINLIAISNYLCVDSYVPTSHKLYNINQRIIDGRSTFQLLAKKKTTTKFNAPPPPSKSEKQSRADQFDAVTRKFMFTISKLSKSLPDGSRTILKNINLCFYPGAKIGVVGLNGSGKSTLLKIMAGVEKQFDGVAVPMPGASIGYLPQEPTLEGIRIYHISIIAIMLTQKT